MKLKIIEKLKGAAAAVGLVKSGFDELMELKQTMLTFSSDNKAIIVDDEAKAKELEAKNKEAAKNKQPVQDFIYLPKPSTPDAKQGLAYIVAGLKLWGKLIREVHKNLLPGEEKEGDK